MKITDCFLYKSSEQWDFHETDDPKYAVVNSKRPDNKQDNLPVKNIIHNRSNWMLQYEKPPRKRLPKYGGQGPSFKLGQVLAHEALPANQRRQRWQRQRERIVL